MESRLNRGLLQILSRCSASGNWKQNSFKFMSMNDFVKACPRASVCPAPGRGRHGLAGPPFFQVMGCTRRKGHFTGDALSISTGLPLGLGGRLRRCTQLISESMRTLGRIEGRWQWRTGKKICLRE